MILSFLSGKIFSWYQDYSATPFTSLTDLYLVLSTGGSFSPSPTFGHALLSAFYTSPPPTHALETISKIPYAVKHPHTYTHTLSDLPSLK